MKFESKIVRGALAVLAIAGACGIAVAQDYPARPIRLIVPAAPAGAADTLSRLLAQKIAESWGNQVIVDNRVGAAGIVGMEAIAKAPNDGYTVGMGFAGTLAVNPSLYARLPYDALRDYAAVRAEMAKWSRIVKDSGARAE